MILTQQRGTWEYSSHEPKDGRNRGFDMQVFIEISWLVRYK